MPNLSNQSLFYGGTQVANPANIINLSGSNVPGTNVAGLVPGTLAVNNSQSKAYMLVSKSGGTGTWALIASGSGDVVQLTGDTGTATPNAGSIKIAGTANQITTTGSSHTMTLSLPSALTAPGSVTATTTLTATLGAITATNGNLVASTAGNGVLLPVNTGSGAASGSVTCNGRQGSCSFTSPSIAGGAVLTLTMSNSSITGSGTLIIYSVRGATTGAALCIQSVTNSASSSAVVINNGTGATTQTGTITLDFIILN